MAVPAQLAALSLVCSPNARGTQQDANPPEESLPEGTSTAKAAVETSEPAAEIEEPDLTLTETKSRDCGEIGGRSQTLEDSSRFL